jgi:UDP-GlcNAc:undecaprenyl-phosphate GlcNAc-1-phosphate transferase
MFKYILIFLIAAGTAYIFTPVALRLAVKIGAMDVPNDDRRMHTNPIPRLGGIAIYLGTIISIVLMLPFSLEVTGILIGGTVILITGIIDDIYKLSPWAKLTCQAVSAIIVFAFGVRIHFIGVPLGSGYLYFPWIISLIITVIWIAGITNTINLIDGLDGLAAGVAAIASLSLAYIAYINQRPEVALVTLAVAGSAMGFLPFNFNPAKIFMGDGGSLFLGFMLAAVSIVGPMKGAAAIATIIPVLVLGLPIFDTAFAIFRRIMKRKPIMEADKEHLHHRILSKGMDQKRTVIVFYTLSGILGIAAVLVNNNMFVYGALLIILTFALVYVFTYTKPEEQIDDNQKNSH